MLSNLPKNFIIIVSTLFSATRIFGQLPPHKDGCTTPYNTFDSVGVSFCTKECNEDEICRSAYWDDKSGKCSLFDFELSSEHVTHGFLMINNENQLKYSKSQFCKNEVIGKCADDLCDDGTTCIVGDDLEKVYCSTTECSEEPIVNIQIWSWNDWVSDEDSAEYFYLDYSKLKSTTSLYIEYYNDFRGALATGDCNYWEFLFSEPGGNPDVGNQCSSPGNIDFYWYNDDREFVSFRPTLFWGVCRLNGAGNVRIRFRVDECSSSSDAFIGHSEQSAIFTVQEIEEGLTSSDPCPNHSQFNFQYYWFDTDWGNRDYGDPHFSVVTFTKRLSDTYLRVQWTSSVGLFNHGQSSNYRIAIDGVDCSSSSSGHTVEGYQMNWSGGYNHERHMNLLGMCRGVAAGTRTISIYATSSCISVFPGRYGHRGTTRMLLSEVRLEQLSNAVVPTEEPRDIAELKQLNTFNVQYYTWGSLNLATSAVKHLWTVTFNKQSNVTSLRLYLTMAFRVYSSSYHDTEAAFRWYFDYNGYTCQRETEGYIRQWGNGASTNFHATEVIFGVCSEPNLKAGLVNISFFTELATGPESSWTAYCSDSSMIVEEIYYNS